MPQPRQAPARAQRARTARQGRPTTPEQTTAWRRGLAVGGAATALTSSASVVAAAAPAALVAAIAAKGARKLTDAQVKAAIALLLRALRGYARQREPQIIDLAVSVFLQVVPDASAPELLALRRMEAEYHAEYLRKLEERVQAEMRRALAAGDSAADPAQARRDAVDALVKRERRWAIQHEEAVASRATGWADAVAVGRASPDGVVWILGKRRTHTPDCVAMHGKLWPLQALVAERMVPPVHYLCGCRLLTKGEGVARGLVKASAKPPSLAAARVMVRKAQALEHGHADEDDDTGRAVEAFRHDQPRWPKGHPRAGQWRPKAAAGAGIPGKLGDGAALARDLAKLQKALDAHDALAEPGRGATVQDHDASTVAVGKVLAGIASRHGTMGAYEDRLAKVTAESDAIHTARLRGAAALREQDPSLSLGAAFLAFGKTDEGAKVLARNTELMRKRVSLEKAIQRARQDAYVYALGRVRPMGGKLKAGPALHEHNEFVTVAATGPELQSAASLTDDVARMLPSAWIDASNAAADPLRVTIIPRDGRASYRSSGLQAGRLRVRLKDSSTMLHEMGHRMEHVLPAGIGGTIGQRGARYRRSRAPQEREVALATLRPSDGYRPDEVTLKDRWIDPYTGKVYAGDRHTEVLTMGLQRLFYPVGATDTKRDKAHLAWVLGILATG